jgi:hypothetical protein
MVIASSGHKEIQSPQALHSERSMITFPLMTAIAFSGQASTQSPHPVHRSTIIPGSGIGFMDSALEHHLQLKGHPFMKMVVRIPGPSWTENFWILNIIPDTSVFIMVLP